MSSVASDAVVAVAAGRRPRRLVLDRAIAGCFGVSAALHVGFGVRGLLAGALVVVLVELAAIDLERRVLPNRIVLPTLVAVLGVWLVVDATRWFESLAWAAGAGAFLLLPSLVRPGAVGMGDVKLGVLLGAALGNLVPAALVVGLCGAGGYALLLLMTRGRTALRQEMPLGPFLAGGAIAAILFAAPTAF